jgi:tetratricopeptide (TPR) repeat protein
MRATLPFASGGLRELAEIWQADLARPMAPSERDALSARLAEVYLQILQTEPDPVERAGAARRLMALHAAVPLDARLLEAVADAADDLGDAATSRRALEVLARHEDPEVRARALERLGDVLDRIGERRAALDSWRPAAEMRANLPSAPAHARRLYERMLDTAPDDRDAAEHLVELYSRADAWDRIPEVFGVVVRNDADRAAELLLRLEADASRAGALDQLAAMVDEALALRSPSSAKFRSLRQAKARALAASPARHEEASATYRALLEMPASGQVNDDVCAYESFIATLRDPATRHSERRWLYEWRVEHGDRPREALIEWAKAEEAFGARELAIALYRRAIDMGRAEEHPALAVHTATLLDELGAPAEAMVVLAPLLAVVPRVETAHAVAREMLGDPRSSAVVATQLEALANQGSGEAGVRLLAILVEAREETLAVPEVRGRWWRSLVERAEGALPVDLDV